MNTSNYTFIKTKHGFENRPSYFVQARFMLIVSSLSTKAKKNRGKCTGFPHTASLKNAAHTLHINQMSVLTYY